MQKENIPNALTFFRVAIVPIALIVAAAFPEQRQLMFWLFGTAAVTDLADGYLARKWNAVSALGTMLDPIADKLLVAIMLLYLQEYTKAPLAAVAIIICREIYIAGLREFLALRQIALPVSQGGKWKTTVQLLALTFLLVSIAYPTPYLRVGEFLFNSWNLGVVLLWLSAILAITSAFDYTRKAMPSLR